MKDWKSIQITENTTVIDAIKIIDSTKARACLVVTDNSKLIGTITDGDIRRAILRGITLDSTVSNVLHKNPITAPVGKDSSFYQAILEKNQIQQLPIIDINHLLCGFYVASDIKESKKINKVILMVGGLGSRLGSLTSNCPKPMLNIGGKPILETIINNLKSEGFTDFYLAVNYKSEVIEDYFKDGSHLGINIKYIREEKRMGTAGSLSLLEEIPNEPIIVMNGDLLTSINVSELIEFHNKNNSQATMCIRNYNFQLPFGVVVIEGEDMQEILEKPTEKRFVNAGIYIVNPSTLSKIPKNQFYDMPTFFNDLLKEKLNVKVFPISGYWLDIGQKEDFEKAHTEYPGIFNDQN
jgi:dTDP-glucose pyrophosphorylase